MTHTITPTDIDDYCLSLRSDERAAGTVAKYRRDLAAFARWIGGAAVTKETAARWKTHLLERGCKPETINSKLSAINGFFTYMNWAIRVKFLKIQRHLFRDPTREMTREEYTRLLTVARETGQERLPVSESTGQYAAAVAAPILCGGDVLGLVLFVSAEDRLPGEGEYKLAQAVAGFLGKHMET